VEMENQVFLRAKNKEEYLGYVARLILHVRQQPGPGNQQQQQGPGAQPSQPQDQDMQGSQSGMGGQQGQPGGMMGNAGGPGMGQQQIMQQKQQMMMQQQQGQGPGMRIQPGQQMNLQQQQMMQQQQQQQMMQQQQQQRMMMNMRMQQQQQRQPISQLEQRLQQQQQNQPMMMRGGPNMGGVMRQPGMPAGPPGMAGRAPPPNYMPGLGSGGPISGSSSVPAVSSSSGPSPLSYLPQQSPGMQTTPSPGGSQPVPSPQGGPQSKGAGSLAPSPSPGGSSGVNTPLGAGQGGNMTSGPASQEDREYLEKVKQLEKYIEPLRRMILTIGNNDQDRLTKMKKLLDILSNPDKRMPIATLQKCEDVLKRMALDTVEPEGGGGAGGEQGKDGATSLNPLIEAVLKLKGSSQLNHSLSRTFLPPLQALSGCSISLPPPPPSPPQEEEEEEIPWVLQGEIARLESRFKVWLSSSQPSHCGREGSIELVCQLEDKDLPTVPYLEVSIPSDYPNAPPLPNTRRDYLATPFLARLEEAFNSRLVKMPAYFTLSQLLVAWELSVRSACSPAQAITSAKELTPLAF